MSEPRKFHDWSWCRELLSQGGDIYHDRMPGGYEVYSARLDAAARERADELQTHCVSRETADQLAATISIALTCSDLEAHRGDLKDALAAYRQSGPPCPGCCGTEPASPQSWRCLRHQLLDALAHAATLEEALQKVANCDNPIITKSIARKALAAKP